MVILALVLAVVSAVAILLSLSQQIKDAAALEQRYLEEPTGGEHDGHHSEEAWKSQITPLTTTHFVLFGVAGVLWLALLANLFSAHIYFMSSLFLGLTVVSIPFVALAEKAALRRRQNLPFALLGTALVVTLTILRGSTGPLTVNMAGRRHPLRQYKPLRSHAPEENRRNPRWTAHCSLTS